MSAFRGAVLRTVLGLALGASVTAAAADDGTVIPLHIRENFPLVEVRVGGQKVSLLFDTGGPWTFEVVNFKLPDGFEGFLGYDFYARHVACMDFPDKKLLVRKS